jgi:hypothetical protein
MAVRPHSEELGKTMLEELGRTMLIFLALPCVCAEFHLKEIF